MIDFLSCLYIVGGPYNSVYFDQYGDGKMDWVVNLFYNVTEQGMSYLTLFRYNITAEHMIPVALSNPNVTIPWPGNRTSPPTGEPPCGWDGCPDFFNCKTTYCTKVKLHN